MQGRNYNNNNNNNNNNNKAAHTTVVVLIVLCFGVEFLVVFSHHIHAYVRFHIFR